MTIELGGHGPQKANWTKLLRMYSIKANVKWKEIDDYNITKVEKCLNITIGCVFYGFIFIKQTFRHVNYTSKNDQLLTTYKLDIWTSTSINQTWHNV
jgi:hypothetical protein